MTTTASLQEKLRNRTKRFALSVIQLVAEDFGTESGRVIGKQLLRSATSVAANYRSAGRARSRREFASRIGVVLEEADESVLWLELLAEAQLSRRNVILVAKEARELVAIFSASYETARRRKEFP